MRPLFTGALLTIAAVTATGLATTGSAQAAAPPPNVFLKTINYGGSGCPAGTANVSLSNGGAALTLLFDSFVVSKGPGIPVTQNRKSCQLALDVNVPAGWSFSATSVRFQGHVQLPAAATANRKAHLYFSGQTQTENLSHPFVGPMSRDYDVSVPGLLANHVWSPCGGHSPLNIREEANITLGNGTLLQDSDSDTVNSIYALNWRRC